MELSFGTRPRNWDMSQAPDLLLWFDLLEEANFPGRCKESKTLSEIQEGSYEPLAIIHKREGKDNEVIPI